MGYGCEGRIVGLRDKTNSDIALGVIKSWDMDAKCATVLTPLSDTSQVRCIVAGDTAVKND